jgi:integrase
MELFRSSKKRCKRSCIETAARLDPSNLRRAFYSVLKADELPRIRYHDRRHTYASTLLKAGVEIAEVSKLLDHSSIIITLDVYVHFIPQKERPLRMRWRRPGSSVPEGMLESGNIWREDQTCGA